MKINTAALRDYREHFVATLAHDLCGPLAAANMAAHLIATAPANIEQMRAWAATVERSLERMNRVMADVVDVSLLAEGRGIALDLEPCDISAIATALADEMGGRIKIETQGEIKGMWSSDALTRILENLLSNAVNHGDAAASITLRLRRREDRVLISVHNAGAPIAPDQQGGLFDGGARSRDATGQSKQRWGLALVHGLVAAHGGVVNVASCLVDGTTFTVDLPVMPRVS